jgi:hypothetical protein
VFLLAASLLGLLFFNPENGSDIYLRNINGIISQKIELFNYSVCLFVLQRRAVAAENSVSKLKQELKLVSVSGLSSVGSKAEYSAIMI